MGNGVRTDAEPNSGLFGFTETASVRDSCTPDGNFSLGSGVLTFTPFSPVYRISSFGMRRVVEQLHIIAVRSALSMMV